MQFAEFKYPDNVGNIGIKGFRKFSSRKIKPYLVGFDLVIFALSVQHSTTHPLRQMGVRIFVLVVVDVSTFLLLNNF